MKDKKFRTFLTIWSGQLVSRLGTAMTRFALLTWAYRQTDSALVAALLGFFAFIPMTIISPFAGVWIDRLDRKKIMLVADTCSGMTTLVVWVLFLTGGLALWHLYVLEAMLGIFEAFQGPAYTSLTSQLLPKEQYARASGLRSIANDGGNLAAPFLAGFILARGSLSGVLLVDLATMAIAVGTVVWVSRNSGLSDGMTSQDSAAPTFWRAPMESGGQFRQELQVGFRYIRRHTGLLGLMLIYAGLNFIDSLAWLSILPVMILARSGGDEMVLASVQGAFGLASIAGGILVAVWGGPKRKIHAALLGPALSFLFGGVIIAVGRTPSAWMLGAWAAMFFVPILSGGEKAIWQSKVALHVQGRVFSVNNMVRQAAVPFGMLLGGLLADRWFEPAMMPGGSLVPLFGRFVGTGPGSGMAVLFLLTAFVGSAVSLSGYLVPSVREIENKEAEPAAANHVQNTLVFAMK